MNDGSSPASPPDARTTRWPRVRSRRAALRPRVNDAGPRHRHAERREVVRRDDGGERLPRHVALADADGRERVRHQTVEDVRRRDRAGRDRPDREIAVALRHRAVRSEDRDELVDPSGPRLQQQRVDQREHRRVHADAERQDQDRDEREPRRPAKQADAVAEIVHLRPYSFCASCTISLRRSPSISVLIWTHTGK